MPAAASDSPAAAPTGPRAAPHADASTGVWTCPFCPLLCDHLKPKVVQQPGRREIRLGPVADAPPQQPCARADAAAARFASGSEAQPCVDGQPVSWAQALQAAALALGACRQPLFTGMGTDVAGARALYGLAAATGAIVDHGLGDAFIQTLRVLQDQGSFTATLGELHTRADVVVCVNGLPLEAAPLLLDRIGLTARSQRDGSEVPGERSLWVMGEAIEPAAVPALAPGVQLQRLPDTEDPFAALAGLAAALRPNAAPNPRWAPLIHALARARYAVFIVQPGALPAHGALAIEAVMRLVAERNRKQRAAMLLVGGGDGAASVNQVFAWLSGLPIRSRAGAAGLEHEPWLFDAQRLAKDAAVDGLLHVACFGSEPPPPALASGGARIVIGHPAHAPLAQQGVFLPASTPGIGSAGHLFRTDGLVLVPLHRVLDDGLPTVAEIVRGLLERLPARFNVGSFPPAAAAGSAAAFVNAKELA